MTQRAANVFLACAAATICALAACDRGGAAAADETAAELRALRLFLQQQPQHRPNAATTTPAEAAQALGDAFAPLRDVVTALAAAQREQAARQLAMTQEMQRWSQLVVESVSGTRADEAKTMAARLRQLEQALQEEEARHRQVEATLQDALERTGDRLEQFLKLLEGRSAPSPAAPTPAPVEPAPAAPARSDTAPAPTPAASRTSQRTARSVEPWLWAALGVAGLGLGAFFVRRALRPRPLDAAAMQSRGQSVPIGPDPGVDEIWAAAALLGETVTRLRQSAALPPAIDNAPVAAVAPTDGVDFDAAFALGGVATADATSPAVPAPIVPPAPPPAAAPHGPQLVVCRLPVADAERAHASASRLLAGDPRVLRRPAPALVTKGGRLEVTFAVLPGLAAGERSQLEQRLRETVV